MIELFQALWNMMPSTFMIASPILIAATGGLVCERAGVVNIALEGLMVLGAVTAAISVSHFGLPIPAAMLAAAIVGGAFSLIHAFAAVTLRADQVISGAGINLLSLGLAVFVCQLLFAMDRTPPHRGMMRGDILGLFPTAWLALAVLAVTAFALYGRPWGLRLRAAGENPQALEAAGVNVSHMRYAAVIISGLLAGLAGGGVVLTQDIQFTTSTINGTGFIALAAVSFGRWLPLGILGSSLLFGMATALAVNFVNIPALRDLFPSEFFSMMPYLITLVALVVFKGRGRATFP